MIEVNTLLAGDPGRAKGTKKQNSASYADQYNLPLGLNKYNKGGHYELKKRIGNIGYKRS